MAVLLGAQRVDDVSRNYGIDVYDTYDYTVSRYNYNGQLNVTCPITRPPGRSA